MDFYRWLKKQKQVNSNSALSINDAGNPVPFISGEQTVRLLGPFIFDGAEDDIIGGVALTSLAAGVIVIDAWAVVSSDFTTIPGPALATVAIGVGTLAGADWADVVVREGSINESATWSASPFASNTTQRLVQAKDGASLIAYVLSGDGDPSGQGVADIYALIAEPVSE